MANIRDVAMRAGVSPSTVSRIITGATGVSREKKDRVFKAIAELNYQVHRPSSEVSSVTEDIGIIIPKDAGIDLAGHPAFSSAISAFEKEMKRQGKTTTLILLSDYTLKHFSKIIKNKYAAYFILGTNEEQEDEILPFFKETQIPYMILNRWVNERAINYVNVDDAMAAQQGTEYLLHRGHSKIAFIGGNKNFRNSKLRIKGYEQAMENAGISITQEYILQGEYSEAFGYSIGEQIISLNPRPTAALVSSDMIAIGLQRKLRELRFSLPKDFSMVGWGDFTVASYVTPPLTTIGVPTSEMGTQAAIAITNMLKHPHVMGVQILMNAPLIIRKSCGE
ncbi:MAG: LacI family transcriptional regulator [Sphaerochaetaceae bacterium]|nr:LacI family transcriptional regulator [Sphaerochaetaceae bacterium]